MKDSVNIMSVRVRKLGVRKIRNILDKSVMGNLSDGRLKPKKRSLVERELETSLTARVTSPLSHSDSSSTSRYGRSRRLKSDTDNLGPEKLVSRTLKSPSTEKSPATQCSPVYKMHASNSPVRIESPMKVIPTDVNLENQIENIYHENISLSRFGSEDKKMMSPAKKFSKIYVRKDMIQNVDNEDIVPNTFSSGKKTSTHLNNILERSSDKYSLNGNVSLNSNRSKNGHIDTSSVVKTLDFDSGKKKRENRDTKSVSKSEMFEIEAKCEYQVGDLAWARVGTYPFWPCIVTREPMSGIFVKKKLFGRVEHDIIHVTFFGDNGRRGWIVDNMLRKYLGVLEFEATKEEFTAEAKKKDPKFYAAFFISEKKLPQWNISVKEAERLLREPKRLRIDILNEMIQISRSSKSGAARASSQTTRTNSDVSLSESLYDTLFSEDDGKSEDFDRSRSKTRKKSLDVSEVVTACLDNMAAKTGITKIQRQSHMDRWLQKAKSKTPEKSQPKTAQSNDKSFANNSKKKQKLSSENLPSQKSDKVPLLKKYFTESHNKSQNYLKSHENEHDYTSPTSKSKEQQSVSPKTVINGDEDESIHGIDETLLNKPHNVASDEINGVISYSKDDTSMNQTELIVEEIIFGSDEIACENITVVENNILNEELTLGQDNLKTFKLTDDDKITKCDLGTTSDFDTIIDTAPTCEIDTNHLVHRKTNDQTESNCTLEKLETELNVEQISDEAKSDVSEEEITCISLETAEKNITDIEIDDKFNDNKSRLDDNVQICNTNNTDEKQLVDDEAPVENVSFKSESNDQIEQYTTIVTAESETDQATNGENIDNSGKGICPESTIDEKTTDVEIDNNPKDYKPMIHDEKKINTNTNTGCNLLKVDKNAVIETTIAKVFTDTEFAKQDKKNSKNINDKSDKNYESRLDDNVQISNTGITDEKQLVDDEDPVENVSCKSESNVHIEQYTTIVTTENETDQATNGENIDDSRKGICPESTIDEKTTDVEIDNNRKDYKPIFHDEKQTNTNINTACNLFKVDKNAVIETTIEKVFTDTEFVKQAEKNNQYINDKNADNSEQITLESVTDTTTDFEIDEKFKNETHQRDPETVEIERSSQDKILSNVNDISAEEALVYEEDYVNLDKNASSEEMSEVQPENCEKNDLNIDKLDTDKNIYIKYGDLTNKNIDVALDYENNDINSIKMFEEQILNGTLDADSDTVSSIKNKVAMECKGTDSINNLNNGQIEQIKNDMITENMTNAMIVIPYLDKTDSKEDKVKETLKIYEEKNVLLAQKIMNPVKYEKLVEMENHDLQTGKDDSRINNIVLDGEEKMTNEYDLVNSIANNECLDNRCHNIKESGPQRKIKDEYDTISINSEDSEISLGKKKTRSKNGSRQGSNNMTEALENPDFLQYLELRQDVLIDENPQLTQEEIVNYLYKTWLYEENLKSDTKKTDDMEQSNLVKGLKQEPVQKPKKARRKKAEKEPIFEVEVDEELPPKDKPKRKLAKPLYNYDCSDIEEEIEMFEIFKSKKPLKSQKSESSTSESQKLDTENLNLQIVKKNEATEVIEEISSDVEYDQVEEYFKQLTKPKPNLFKGLVREKVCDICERPTHLVKCKVCRDMFHIDCVKKQSEIVEAMTPTRGRKKKKKPRGRKPKSLDDSSGLDSESHSDTKSQDANLSEEYQNMSIEEVMEQESHIVINADDFEAYASVKMQELFENPTVSNYYNNDFDIQWKVSVVGHCEIVDVKFTNESTDADNSDFKCHNCQKYNVPVCFVCKLPVSPKNQVEHRQKCAVGFCNKYYHLECLDHWPQTQYNSGECRSKGNAQFEPLTCARHVCHTCVSDDPRGCKTRFSSDKLAHCVRCPATYHCFTKCLPAGTQILTGSYIICPRHYEHRPGKVPCHVNTGWCFICALGGSLICCEYCPTSFHAECLNIKPPEGGYMCEDCETGRLPLYGEMVWVKLGHYRWWPGMILHPSEIPHNIMAVKHSLGEFVVRFFGQYDHYWVNRGRVFPFQEGDSGKVSSQKSKIDEAFSTAMEHAQRACQTLKGVEPNAEECHELALSLLPPQYVKLKCNKPCGPLVGWRPDDAEHSLTQCECDPAEEGVCGPYTSCINRMLLTECGPSCRAGDRCNNRAFEKRQYPRMVPYRTPHRGWGLKTLEDIKQGQFVIEYVGELIDLEEFQRRMRRKHEVRDENYYFLTLDKERMIDAGPKGNLARFMNHCCEPNCETQKWTVLGDVRVGLFALRDIPANSELTFNYNLESDGIEKKRCLCGARRCAGYIGAKPKQDEQVKKSKRVYKKRKPTEESPTTSFKSKPKPRLTTRSAKPKELTDIEKDLLIIKSATNAISSDSDASGRLSSIESERKDNRPPKRKRVDCSTDEPPSANGIMLPHEKRLKIVLEKSSVGVGD